MLNKHTVVTLLCWHLALFVFLFVCFLLWRQKNSRWFVSIMYEGQDTEESVSNQSPQIDLIFEGKSTRLKTNWKDFLQETFFLQVRHYSLDQGYQAPGHVSKVAHKPPTCGPQLHVPVLLVFGPSRTWSSAHLSLNFKHFLKVTSSENSGTYHQLIFLRFVLCMFWMHLFNATTRG